MTRLAILVAAMAIVAVACTPTESSKEGPTESTTTTTPTTTTTTAQTDTNGELLPPDREDPSVVAREALKPVAAFDEMFDPPQTTEDLLVAIENWLPTDLVVGDAQDVFEDTNGNTVAVVSVIPQLTWRGDPGFVPSLIEALTGSDPASPEEGIFTAETDGGAVMELWSTGDGFVVASSHDSGTAVDYLSGLNHVTDPNGAWASGDCLFIDEDEDLPYAPFPRDVVVPCSGAHNAEVLVGLTTGTDLTTFDDAAIEQQRNYDCDLAYNDVFGDQRTHAPGLVTYMPDEDEWDRGDRYLACVVIIDRNDGKQLFTGAMADLDDLVFEPPVEACLLDSLPADTVDCATAHIYQYVGDATIDAEGWPDPDDAVFDDACASLIEVLNEGPAELAVFAVGLGPYAFDTGDRTVRCMAYATVEGFIVDVLGGFDGPWRIVGQGGIPA